MAAHTVLTTCKVGACEKFCGIRAEVEDGRFARVKFDRDHPVTRGCGCIKGLHTPDYQNDPDRILRPQKRTETAQIASEHLAIRPGFDLIFLLAMIRRLLRTQAFDRDYVHRHTAGFERWLDLVTALELDAAVPLTGLAPGTIDRIADEFAAADSAFATTRVGVQTGHNATLTEWAVMTLNAITGNIDRPGGVFFNPGAVDVPGLIEKFARHDNKSPSRIGGFPQIFGGQPAATFADDVLSDDPGRIRALVAVAGNPVISFPATRKIEQALARLELLVCIDLYRSDTGAFAHYNLPAATSFEKDSIHFMTSNCEPFPYLEWRPRVVEPRGEARCEWDIYRELSRAAGVPFLNHRWLDRATRAANALGVKLGSELLYHAVLPRGAGLHCDRRRTACGRARSWGGASWRQGCAPARAASNWRRTISAQRCSRRSSNRRCRPRNCRCC